MGIIDIITKQVPQIEDMQQYNASLKFGELKTISASQKYFETDPGTVRFYIAVTAWNNTRAIEARAQLTETSQIVNWNGEVVKALATNQQVNILSPYPYLFPVDDKHYLRVQDVSWQAGDTFTAQAYFLEYRTS